MTSRGDGNEAPRGLVVGGRGGPLDEMLESGQEEVFSRAEVESGLIEHHVGDDERRVPEAAGPDRSALKETGLEGENSGGEKSGTAASSGVRPPEAVGKNDQSTA